MEEKEEKLLFAACAMMGLVARGATPAEVRDMMWIYADFAMAAKPNENDSQ